MRGLLLTLSTAALALGALGVPASAAGTVRMVDDDGKASVGQCNGTGTASKKIQKAIDASGKNDTVLVCPGTYRETLVIGPAKDGLTVRSKRPWAAKLVARADEIDSALIEIRPGADRITIQHFSIKWRAGQNRTPAGKCGADAAIMVLGRDAVIRANRVRAFGETLGPCGMWAGIQVGYGVSASAAAGPAGGPPPASALASHNTVRDFVFQGIAVAGENASATVTGNSVRYWHLDQIDRATATAASRRPAAALRRMAQAPADPAGLSCCAYGINVYGADAIVTDNEVSSGPDAYRTQRKGTAGLFTPLLGEGIAVWDANGVLVAGNTVRQTGIGIVLAYTVDSTIRRNVSEFHDTGILVFRSADNRIKANQVSTGIFGIYVKNDLAAGLPAGIPAQDNRFIENSALFHLALDCYDGTAVVDTAGSYDHGTANTWRDNVGQSADPSGICQWD